MAASTLEKPPETSALHLSLERTARPEPEPSDLFWDGDSLICIGRQNSNCAGLQNLTSEIRGSFQDHLISFAKSGKYALSSVLKATTCIANSLVQHPTSKFDLTWLVSANKKPGFQSSKGAIASFFHYWHNRYPQAISADALQYLSRRRRVNGKARNVLSDDPEKSWLTNQEYDALLRSTWDNYDKGNTGTQATLMRLLSLQYARRPIQLANLKFCDLHHGLTLRGAASDRYIHFPGAKDQGAQNNFRDSKEEVHPVAEHLWALLQIQKCEVKAMFEQYLDQALSEHELSQLPMFTSQTRVEQSIRLLSEHYRVDWRSNLASQHFHLVPIIVSKVLRWKTNTLGDNHASKPMPPLSHRTGEPIKLSATRMRHTRARQLARLGTPKHVLSVWLGHEDEGSLDSYYNDPAEEARLLDDAMKVALAPLAMAFTGKLLDDESFATRANDPDSTLEFASQGNLKRVGKCGKHSFCATTSVPIPCYRCRMFEPLVHAPHEEVLHALLKRQADEDAMIKIGGTRKLLTPIDLGPDIRAVQACIAHCNARIAHLNENHD